jgi:hypothetical protein
MPSTSKPSNPPFMYPLPDRAFADYSLKYSGRSMVQVSPQS